MKKYSIIFFCALTLSFLFNSCVKDKSIGPVNNLPELTITGLSDTIIVSVDDTLKLYPKLSSNLEVNDNGYSYLWYAYTTDMQFVADTLSKEKEISTPIRMYPGQYKLVFMATDRETGVFYKETKDLFVRNDYSPGLMILGEDEDEAILDFYNTSTKKYIEQVYRKSNNNEKLGLKPISVNFYPQNYQMPAEVFVLCNDMNGGVFADPSTFQKLRSLANSFFVEVDNSAFLNPMKYVEVESNLQDYVIIDGKPYNRAVNSGDLLFKPAMVGDFFVSNQVFSANSARPVFFDMHSRQFLAHNNTGGTLNPLKMADGSVVDPDDVGLDLVYAGGISENNFFGLFKDPNQSEYYIINMAMNGLSLSFNATDKYLMKGEEISTAVAFSSSSSLPNYLFYSSGSRCYVFNTFTSSGGLLFDLGDQYEINLLKMKGFEIQMGFINKSRSEKKGGFSLMNITTDGGIKATETFRKEGIAQRIVDLSYKD